MRVVQEPNARNSFTGDADNVVLVGGSIYGDVTIGPSPRPGPNAVAARPYLLLETGEAVGRADLRRCIDEFLAGTGTAVLLLIGVPGIGKSALAWDSWKRRRAAGARQFWYSFYDGRGVGSFAAMLPELARFLGLPDTAHVGAVLDAVAGEEVLLFLDGIERCLRCYQRPLDPAQCSDDELWHDSELGFASDDALRFFQQLTELPAGRVVATSRVVPADYFASGGALRAGVTSHVVGPLPPGDGSALLDRIGTPLTPADAAMAASVLGGHPLALQLLARQVRRSLRPRQSLPQWLAEQGFLAPDGSGPRRIRDLLFVRAAAALSAPACVLLAATGVLGGSVDLPTLRAVDPSALTDDQFHRAVQEVVASGLAVATAGGELGCHPLTGAAATARLEPGQATALVRVLSSTLRGRFTGIDAWGAGYAGWYATADVSDRAEAMALCRALVRLGEWQAAAQLYDEQLDIPVRLVLGANFEAVELLSALVAGLAAEPGEIRPDRLRPSLAHHLLMIGRVEQAAHELDKISDDPRDHAVLLVRAAVCLHRGDFAGALDHGLAAVHAARRRLAAALQAPESDLFGPPATQPRLRPSGDQVEALVRCAEVLALAGRPAEAAKLLVESLAVLRVHGHCSGCRGLVLRTAAAVFAVSGDADAARAAAVEGRALQAGEGRTLQGVFADVVVAARLPHVLPDLAGALGDAGFVLYQLSLRDPAALLGHRVPPLPASLVHRAVGWLGPSGGHESGEHAEALLRLAGEAVEVERPAAPQHVLEIDPCDIPARKELAALAVREGRADTALDHLAWLIDLDEQDVGDCHEFAAELVSGPGRFADAVRDLLVNGVGALAAVDALIVLETELGDDAAVLRWREVRRELVHALLPGFW